MSDRHAAPRAGLIGISAGFAASTMWAAYFAYSRLGLAQGLQPVDLVFLRYSVAGAIMLPWLVRYGLRDFGGVGWRRGVVLAFFAGPIFVALGTGGYLFAPLAHGAVLQPSTAAVVTAILGWWVLGEQARPNQVLGTALLIAGISIIASRSLTAAEPNAWIGDLMFLTGGLFWVGYTLCLRRWSVPGVAATAAVSVLSVVVVVPAFFAFTSLDRLAALPPLGLLAQILAQGVGAGVLALIAFGIAVHHLGAGRAALFPALVPALTLVIGIPVAGEIPDYWEMAGAGLASIGLAIAVGATRRS